MDLQLDAVAVRVLGALMEKEATTPEYYPLSLNALVNACNQRSNREPVVNYDDETVEEALQRLRAVGVAVRISGESRVPKHGERFAEKYNLGRREAAVMCVLMLRGPQTVGELRGRTERMYTFDDLEGVENTIQHLAEMGFVQTLARRAGSREPRHGHLLCGPIVEDAAPEAEAPIVSRPSGDRIAELEKALAQLRAEFDEFRKGFE
jgi:uncharacterized protein YceH (UPF0502 family)